MSVKITMPVRIPVGRDGSTCRFHDRPGAIGVSHKKSALENVRALF
jgi:hypothetical protein